MCSLCSLVKIIVFRKVCASALVVTFVCKCLGVFAPGFHEVTKMFPVGLLSSGPHSPWPQAATRPPYGSCDPFHFTLCHVISTSSWHTVSSPGHFLSVTVAAAVCLYYKCLFLPSSADSLFSLTGMTLTCGQALTKLRCRVPAILQVETVFLWPSCGGQSSWI